MPSPFPGMDPYIESTADWHSFHNHFIAKAVDRLNERLPPEYVATPESQVRLVPRNAGDRERQNREPDVAVSRERVASDAAAFGGPAQVMAGPGDAAGEPGAVATLAPKVVEFADRLVETDEWIVHVRLLPGRELVTAIELLSPTNKEGRGRREYARKRVETVRRGTNLVEVDLLLGGRRPTMRAALPGDGYYALVCRVDAHPLADVYDWAVRDPLPTLPVPLRPEHDDVPLDLADLFAQTYAAGRYERLARYDFPPPPRLGKADRAWAAGLAATAGRERPAGR